MSGRRRVAPDEFAVAYAAWPGSEHDKTALKALLLRYRIEAVASGLPSTVVSATGTNRIRQRLMLAVGEPGLDDDRRIRRMGVARAAIAAYEAICDVLHGRVPDTRPPLVLVTAWEDAVVHLEVEFASGPVAPAQRPATTGRTRVYKGQ